MEDHFYGLVYAERTQRLDAFAPFVVFHPIEAGEDPSVGGVVFARDGLWGRTGARGVV